MSVMQITSENFESEVLKADKPVVLDFYADWCGPCKMMSPIIDNIAEELGDRVKVGKVNSDNEMDLAEQFGIMSIPTIIIFKEGKPVQTFVGVTEKSKIVDSLK